MSRNHKIRTIADKLPDIPVIRKGKIAHDGYGRVIMQNHFRRLKEINDEPRLTPDQKQRLSASYIHNAMRIYALRQRKRNWRAFKSWGILAIFMLIGLYLYITNHK